LTPPNFQPFFFIFTPIFPHFYYLGIRFAKKSKENLIKNLSKSSRYPAGAKPA